MEYIEQYKQIHKGKKYGTSGDHLVETLFPYLSKEMDSLLDFGCGQSNTAELIRKKAGLSEESVDTYDPAIEGKDVLKDRTYHTIICTDVLEHIPLRYLEDVLLEIWARLEGQAYFVIAMKEAAQFLPNGENAHCTIEQKEWWEKKLRSIFAEVTYLPSPSIPYATSWWKCERSGEIT